MILYGSEAAQKLNQLSAYTFYWWIKKLHVRSDLLLKQSELVMSQNLFKTACKSSMCVYRNFLFFDNMQSSVCIITLKPPVYGIFDPQLTHFKSVFLPSDFSCLISKLTSIRPYCYEKLINAH